MHSLWVAIDSRRDETRVLAMSGPQETVLKARLSAIAQHRRALPTLLEALALWQGRPVRAVVVADDPDGASLTRLKLDGVLADLGADPLYRLELVPGHKRRHRDVLDAMGAFHDLRQLTMFEVAR
jgi:hypothetical protein